MMAKISAPPFPKDVPPPPSDSQYTKFDERLVFWGPVVIGALLLTLIGLLVVKAFAADPPLRPDPHLTPGVARPDVAAADLCPVAHTPALRNVTAAEKAQVYAEYGVKPRQGYCSGTEGCEVDHLISLEIGGADDIKNLWIQPYGGTPWNAHVKDRYENFLHKQVCSGAMTLEAAQDEIRTDWIAGYKRHKELPAVE